MNLMTPINFRFEQLNLKTSLRDIKLTLLSPIINE